MPTYDYVCDGCGHAFELFQSMTDPVKRTCPKCKKKKLRRLIGAGGAIVFSSPRGIDANAFVIAAIAASGSMSPITPATIFAPEYWRATCRTRSSRVKREIVRAVPITGRATGCAPKLASSNRR